MNKFKNVNLGHCLVYKIKVFPLIIARPKISAAPFHTNHNFINITILNVNKLCCIWKKYTSQDKVTKTGSSGIYTTIYGNDSYLSFGEKKVNFSNFTLIISFTLK